MRELLSHTSAVSQEILQCLNQTQVPFHPELQSLLEMTTPDPTYGPGYLLASGKLLRSITRPLSDPNRFRLFPGWTSKTAETLVCSLPTLRHHASKLFVDLAAQTFLPKKATDIPVFPRFHDTRYLTCTQAEVFFATRIDAMEEEGEALTVFADGTLPLIIQKSGVKNTYSFNNATNATGLTLAPLCLSDIILPPGTLVGLETTLNPGIDALDSTPYYLKPHHQTHPIAAIQGIMSLRLTAFAVNKREWEATFGLAYTHELLHYPLPTLPDFQTFAATLISSQSGV